MKLKIFEGKTVREEMARAVKWCKRTGGHIATSEEIWSLREKGKIPMQWYDSSTVVYKGKFRKGTMKELANLKSFYEKGGRVVGVGNHYYGVNRYLSINSYGRSVGVVPEAHKK